MFVVKRSSHNPIVSPNTELPWEAFAAFNGCPIKIKSTTHLLYRAIAHPIPFENTQFLKSVIGKAESKDGVHFTKKEVCIRPEESWERYGCEDPRVTYLDGKYYIFYTALSNFPFNAEGIKVAVAISNDLETIHEKHLVTPFNAKAMSLFPEKIHGKYTVIFTANTDRPPSKIAIATCEKEEDLWSETYWKKWYGNLDKNTLELRRKDTDQVEVGAPPIKTKYGWLVVYSHIQNYYSDNKIFGIEAVLLDLKNPLKIIGRTDGPLLVPEESYEKFGIAPNIIFPSGALVEKDILKIYYGGADTVCAVAYVKLSQLVEKLAGKTQLPFVRSKTNPILKPTKNSWENKAVLNPAVVEINNKIYILYRAVSEENTSVLGYASTKDGILMLERSTNPVYIPREPFEEKRVPNGNSGCEDPRMTHIGNTLYMCYTAYNGVESPAVALTKISVENFLAKKWQWSKPVLISPQGIDDKDACIVAHTKNKKFLFLHRIDHNIIGTYIDIDNPEYTNDHITILEPRPGMWDSKKVGLSVPPIKTEYGWLMIYHGISDNGIYRIGLALLDLKDPTKVISRTTNYIFEPEEKYEKEGIVPNVAFPCGAVVRKGKVLMYYGGGDTVVGMAEAKLDDLLKILGI